MVYLQVLDGEDLQIWRVASDALNKQLQKFGKGLGGQRFTVKCSTLWSLYKGSEFVFGMIGSYVGLIVNLLC
jgi:hypothetical protein